jgi:hypothetical protein
VDARDAAVKLLSVDGYCEESDEEGYGEEGEQEGVKEGGEEECWWAGLLAGFQARAGDQGGNEGELRTEGQADEGRKEGGQPGGGGD